MAATLTPVNSKWLHAYLIEPPLEGAERLNRAWYGYDIHTLTQRPLTLKERAISFLAGCVLLFFPVINTIIWIAWKTFGNPEILSDPYAPLSECSPPRTILSPLLPMRAKERSEQTAPSNPVAETSPIQTQKIVYREKSGDASSTEYNWTLETFPNEIIATCHSSNGNSRSHYTKDGQLKSACAIDSKKNKKYEGWVDGSTLYVKIDEEAPQEYELKNGYPWIQEITFGMRKFILAKDQQRLDFYGYAVTPLKNDTVHAIAEKKGEEIVSGFGKCVKVYLSPGYWLFKRFGDAEAWFDPKSGNLVRMKTNITLWPAMTRELQR